MFSKWILSFHLTYIQNSSWQSFHWKNSFVSRKSKRNQIAVRIWTSQLCLLLEYVSRIEILSCFRNLYNNKLSGPIPSSLGNPRKLRDLLVFNPIVCYSARCCPLWHPNLWTSKGNFIQTLWVARSLPVWGICHLFKPCEYIVESWKFGLARKIIFLSIDSSDNNQGPGIQSFEWCCAGIIWKSQECEIPVSCSWFRKISLSCFMG